MWCLQVRRGRRSDRGLAHTMGAVLVERGDAKAVMQGGTGEVGVPVEEWRVGSSRHRPQGHGVNRGRSSPLRWLVPSKCPKCERHTGWTGSSECVSRHPPGCVLPDVAVELRLGSFFGIVCVAVFGPQAIAKGSCPAA